MKISARGISKDYYIARVDEEVEAIADFTLDVYEGEFLSIVGPSGCGKSTLLRLIAGLGQPKAKALRALARGEAAKAEKLLLDAIQSFATLRLDYERAVAMGDRARALTTLGRGTDAARELEEARALAERLGAAALRGALEAEPVRA